MIDILGTKYYTTGVSVLLAVPFLLVLAAQVVTVLTRSWEAKALRLGRGIYVTLALLVAVVVGTNWDVFVTGQQAKRLCEEQGGLHVYKTVKAEGFLGDGQIKLWSYYGFKYVETGGTQGRRFRVTLKNGKPKYSQVKEYISRYRIGGSPREKFIAYHISRHSINVQDRKTNEILGELVTLSIYPGWFDSRIRRLLGGGTEVLLCGNEAPPGKGSLQAESGRHLLGYDDLVKATIKPIDELNGDQTK